MTLIDCVIILFLLIVGFQDFKYRMISWWLIPVLLFLFILKGSSVLTVREQIHYALFNLTFIVFQLLGLTLYYSLKNKKLYNIIDTQLGLGDILFFPILCVAFAPVNFIIFYLGSLVITLLIFFISRFSMQTKEIPLAGSVAMILMISLLADNLQLTWQSYNDGFFINIL